MKGTLLIIGPVACLVAVAGFFILRDEPAAPDKEAPQAAIAHAPVPPASAPDKARFDWPTPYPFFENKGAPDEAFLQPTVSGNPTSALYGMTRSGGAQFHEGLDIRPVARDRRGEATDAVFAALSGRVAYANPHANGAYGRYVVLEHPLGGVTLYTLYAHLASVSPALRAGERIEAGATLGVLGRSDARGGFPRERAHLHLEAGLRLGDSFNTWYAARRYPDANKHGNFNGFNLAGLDPLALLKLARDNGGELGHREIADWVTNTPVAVTVETPSRGLPGILRRNPALLAGETPSHAPAGWRIGFTAMGVPVRWEPLGAPPPSLRIVSVADGEAGREARRRGLYTTRTVKRASHHAPGATLETALALALQN